MCLSGGEEGGAAGVASTRASCHAFLDYGIVRSVDERTGDIFVLTPLGPKELGTVDTLFVGALQLPQQLLQSDTFISPYVCLEALSVEGTGAGALKGRNDMLRERLQE